MLTKLHCRSAFPNESSAARQQHVSLISDSVMSLNGSHLQLNLQKIYFSLYSGTLDL